MSWRVVEPDEFLERLKTTLGPLRGKYASVCGPGRSGQVAAVYASHYLGIPWIPVHLAHKSKLRPVLVIDTASESGATSHKAARRAGGCDSVFIFNEPPRVKFWYEAEVIA